MAVTLDSAGAVQAWDAASVSFNHTVSGTNCLLVVVTTNRSLSTMMTSVKYNSVDLTAIRQVDGDGNNTEIWYLINPTTGTNAVDIVSPNTDCGAVALSYNGVHQSTPTDANNGSSFSNTQNNTLSITTVAANALIVTGISDGDSTTNHTAGGTDHVERADAATGSGAGTRRLAVGDVLNAGAAGAKSPTWDTGISGSDGSWAVASFKPSVDAPPPSVTSSGAATLLLMGVG